MSTGDATYIRALNKRILIENIIEHQSISRIELSRLTGLNRSTVSSQINHMMEEQLIIERPSEVSYGGRKPILLQMNEAAGYTIGIDFDMPQTQIQIANLLGKPLANYQVQTEDEDVCKNIEKVIENVHDVLKKHRVSESPKGLTGIGIGIHGIVNNDHNIVFTPKVQWNNINMKEAFEKHFDIPIHIDNNANLTVYAEQVYHYPMEDLFSITMYSGIGLGILEGNDIYKGSQGFAGEIGHMIVERNGLQCSCGNKGCWELYASEHALKRTLKAKGYIKHSTDDFDLASIKDESIIEEYLDYMAVGLNNIINIFNPEIVIINSEFMHQHRHLLISLKKRLNSRMNNYQEIVTSSLGKEACSLGGVAISLKEYYGINSLNLSHYPYFDKVGKASIS
ncbi:ROK family transcriptional regulator [Halobacillus trueperi]|uniref:ROK family transcriptional regulator n=1 Tax=Halobacillus trueperi TaxID=156205 RepID=A0A3E0JBH4_9BACI|nr:ROK family transcriptional regulator [Halobacillus trueperi]REJ10286.1 ROK family transcriptional regulator [Halobacillus trueperi]